MNSVTAYFFIMNREGDTFGPTKIGPFSTRESAEAEANLFIGRPGWTVEIVEETVPASDFFDGPF